MQSNQFVFLIRARSNLWPNLGICRKLRMIKNAKWSNNKCRRGSTTGEPFNSALLVHEISPIFSAGFTGVAFDIKKTSYKKLSKLLQKFEKAVSPPPTLQSLFKGQGHVKSQIWTDLTLQEACCISSKVPHVLYDYSVDHAMLHLLLSFWYWATVAILSDKFIEWWNSSICLWFAGAHKIESHIWKGLSELSGSYTPIVPRWEAGASS